MQNNFKNIGAVKELVKAIYDDGGRFANKRNSSTRVVEDVSCENIKHLLSKISVSIANMKFDTNTILSFINEVNSDKLNLWDIAFQSGEGELNYDYGYGVNIKCSKRDYIVNNQGNQIHFTGRGTLGGNTDGQFGLTVEQIEYAKDKYNSTTKLPKKNFPNHVWFSMIENRKPLLIIYSITHDHTVVREGKQLNEYKAELGDNPIVGFAIGIPADKENSLRSKKYKVNTVYMLQLQSKTNYKLLQGFYELVLQLCASNCSSDWLWPTNQSARG